MHICTFECENKQVKLFVLQLQGKSGKSRCDSKSVFSVSGLGKVGGPFNSPTPLKAQRFARSTKCRNDCKRTVKQSSKCLSGHLLSTRPLDPL